jgi:sodium-coupled neutral amino acid transporter 11
MCTGIPSALQQAGFAAGLLLLFLAAVITDYTVLLLIKDGIIASKFTYQV